MGRRAAAWSTGCPNTRADPAVGCTADNNIFTNVVFPAPLGPRNPYVVPRRTCREIPSTARTSRRVQRVRNTFVSPVVSIAESEAFSESINLKDTKLERVVCDESSNIRVDSDRRARG